MPEIVERRKETPEEAAARRERDRIRKQQSRARIAATRFVSYEEWTFGYGRNDSWADRFLEHYAELKKHEEEFSAAVSNEIGRTLTTPEDFTVNRVIVCLVALRKKDRPWICRTTEGIVAGGRYIIEGIATDLIRASYANGLKQQSPIYAQALHELLALLNQLEFPAGISRSEKLVIEQELNGEYEYIAPPPPKKPEPVVAPPKQEPLPSWQDHMNTQAEKFLRQIGEDQAGHERREQMVNDGLLPPEARRYLNGY